MGRFKLDHALGNALEAYSESEARRARIKGKTKSNPSEIVYSFTEDQLIDLCAKIVTRLIEKGVVNVPVQNKLVLPVNMNFYEALCDYTDARTFNAIWSHLGGIKNADAGNWSIETAYDAALRVKWANFKKCDPITRRKIKVFFAKFGLVIEP